MRYDEFHKTLTTCTFCTKSNSRALASREHAYLTYAFAPYHKHHLLVVPRRHVLSIADLTPEEKKDIDALELTGFVALKKLGYEDVTFLMREGPVGEHKSMEHIHFHLIPVVPIVPIESAGWKRSVLTDAEVAETITELQSALSES